MNDLAAEWAEKAEADYWTAVRELRARTRPNWDAVCFHAQQSAEKYLKAFLQQRGADPPRTHSLVELLELCLIIDGNFASQRSILILLDRYAVTYRYPGISADRAEARQAYRAVGALRSFVRQKLGLP
jgi:HEPN domain-containing protein